MRKSIVLVVRVGCRCKTVHSTDQSINQFVSRHSTEARATVWLCRIKEKCLEVHVRYLIS